MLIREKIEQRELETLSPFATKSIYSKGREYPLEKCQIRTDFQRDRDRIIHSKAFRRLMHKTQVFISPQGDHYRTRLSHTLEVSQISRSLSRALSLNEDLTEAIALGHDLGHTPFGHTGESALNEIMINGFEHNEQSVRVVSKIEKLNLTKETLDGIKNHRGRYNPSTLEGKVVQISDKIAYVNHDIDDAIRGNLLEYDDLPQDLVAILGNKSSTRINFIITDIVNNSLDKNEIKLSPEIYTAFYGLRKFMYEKVYHSKQLEKERSKVLHMFKEFYTYYDIHINELPAEYIEMIKQGEDKEIAIGDFIAGMTDRFSISHYNELFLPVEWGK